jgi:hypothetical protein
MVGLSVQPGEDAGFGDADSDGRHAQLSDAPYKTFAPSNTTTVIAKAQPANDRPAAAIR